MCTWSAISRWPRMMAPPPAVQWRPMRALPATPTQPAIALCAPMCTLWPIWIRLSSLTPSSMHGVVERATVDAGVGADLDVVADAHRAELLDLLPAALGRREAEAVGPDHRAGCARCRARRCGSPLERDTRAEPGALADHASSPTRPASRHRGLADAAPARCRPAHRSMAWPCTCAPGLDHRAGWMPARRRGRLRAAHHCVSRAK
jgi:hypothetical protein